MTKKNLFNWLSSPNDEEHPAAKKVYMLYASKRKRRKEGHVSACPVPARVQLSQEKGGKIGYVLVIYTIEREEEKWKGEKAKKVIRRRRRSGRRERCGKKSEKEKKNTREKKRRRNCRMSKDIASFAQLQKGIWYLKFRTWSRRIAPGKCVFFLVPDQTARIMLE